MSYSLDLDEVDELNAVIESSYDGIVIARRDGTIERVNASYERITGIKKHEIVGRRGKDLVAQGILSEYLTDRVIEAKGPVAVVQHYKNGQKAILIGSPVFNKMGEIAKVVFNVRDITQVDFLREQLKEKIALTERYQREVELLRTEHSELPEIVAQSPKMVELLELVKAVATVDATVLMLGESGVGKGEIAKTIHYLSFRHDQPFIKVNCGAIPEALLESELFGYEEGAFSGAKKQGKPGMFELAHRGTIFLDEISELPLALQVKLLHALQEKEFIRVGGTKTIKVDVRIISATNRDMRKLVAESKFREDLYYRLNVVPILIPPLRDRTEDIIPLLQHFLSKFADRYSVKKTFTPEVLEILKRYNWPGNVRELEHIVERMLVTPTQNVITEGDLPDNIRNFNPELTQIIIPDLIPLKNALEEVEKNLVTLAFKRYGNTYKVAEVLGISQPTAYRKIRQYVTGEKEIE